MTNEKVRVATVLEQELDATIERWMKRVMEVPELTRISLSYDDRTAHLPRLIQDLIVRLRLKPKAVAPTSTSAHDHGKVRFQQGYTVPMLVEESRLLQVSIFDTLQRAQKLLDPSMLMRDVVTIADECDAQLKHTVETFMDLEKRGKRGAIQKAS
ncbi:MAG TPA: hypothetical protein VG892_10670 [Terriglobales bacterium]|nr:hypothetical protein [Terriglobales bacterium]